MNLKKEALALHKKYKGKVQISSKYPITSNHDLALSYTPGVAEPCKKIAQNTIRAYDYTMKGNTVAVITDGSAVLGLGNIGAQAALPVMEGKALLFKLFGGIDAFPICLANQDIETTVQTIKNIAPGFGGINLEDFKAPECFIIENALQDIDIPVMHDDQHGTAIVVLAGLINAVQVVQKEINQIRIVINGTGAAGTGIAKLLLAFGVPSKHIILCDRKGILHKTRPDLLVNKFKYDLATLTNELNWKGSLSDALNDADVFIGVSVKRVLKPSMIRTMARDPIIFAMANPEPEITPKAAKSAGAKVIATGRSDYENQVNNVLAFPGIFRGALDVKAKKITERMKYNAAVALASLVKKPTSKKILPLPTNKQVARAVAHAVAKSCTHHH